MNRLRRVAWLLILIADAGLLAWGAMAALAPQHLPGPGSIPILTAGYESFTGGSWSELADASPRTAAFIALLFRMYGVYIVAFGLLAIAVTATAFRRSESWAWCVTGRQHDRVRLGDDVRLDRKRHRAVRDVGIPRHRRNLWSSRSHSPFPCSGTESSIDELRRSGPGYAGRTSEPVGPMPAWSAARMARLAA
jgi:hypothetical protein